MNGAIPPLQHTFQSVSRANLTFTATFEATGFKGRHFPTRLHGKSATTSLAGNLTNQINPGHPRRAATAALHIKSSVKARLVQ